MVTRGFRVVRIGLVMGLAGLISAIVSAAPVGAEGPNQFPGITGASADWTVNRNSPDPNLTWLFKANPPRETISGQTSHILRTRKIGRNEGTRLRIYYNRKPTQVSIRVNVIACELDAPDRWAGPISVVLGGKVEYNRDTYTNRGPSPVCSGPNRLDGKTFSVPFEMDYQGVDRIRPNGSVDPGRDGAFEMGLDPLTNLYFADLDIDLGSRGDPGLPDDANLMQRITFTVQAQNSTTANGRSITPRMGYRLFFVEPARDLSKYFGLQGSGGRVNDFPGYGQKLAIPFGPNCNSTRDVFGRIYMYDPDVQGYGPVYVTVFKRNPANGNVVQLPLDDDYFQFDRDSKVRLDRANRRIESTADSNQDSFFDVKIEVGFQYMMVAINPHLPNKADPSSNVYSFRLPTDSMNGLINCRFELEPSISVSPAFFNAGGATLRVTGGIENTAEGTTSGEHNWKITKVVYRNRPADMNRNRATNSLRTPCQFAREMSGADVFCDPDIYDAVYPESEDHTFNDAVGPYPAGTHVCYFSSVANPTWRDTDDSQRAYSRIACSVAGVNPKVQIWGYDLKATGAVTGSLTQFSANQFYGSWGEYGVFSNGANTLLGSGAGLVTGSPSNNQTDWSTMTFAQADSSVPRGHGNFNGVEVDGKSHNATITINNDTTIDSINDVVPAGVRKAVVRINGRLTINQSLTYPATVTNITQIPRIVFVAEDIVIGPSVTTIDPWLIAVGSGANPGRISTCSAAAGGNFTAFTANNLLSTSICNTPLQFNGPVVADQLYLYRTHDPADGRFDSPDDQPAERFNLRADNFLSSYVGPDTGQPVATTDDVVELPPRF